MPSPSEFDVQSSTFLLRVQRRFRRPSDLWLAARAFAWATVLPSLKHLLPIRALARFMRRSPRRTARDARREDQIVTFARWAARLIRWNAGGNCLERGLIAYRYLSAAGAQPTLVVGVGKNETGVIGHAWVLVDGQPVGESRASLDIYSPVLAFGPDGSLIDMGPQPARPDALEQLDRNRLGLRTASARPGCRSGISDARKPA